MINEDYISKRQDFSKIFNADGDTGKTFNSIFQMPTKAKNRTFTGATTKRGYVPAFNPTNPAFKTMNSALTDGGDAGAGDAGVAMGESMNAKFIGLLEAIRTEENSTKIDLIRKGFSIIHENSDLSDLEHFDDIERAFYGEDEPEPDNSKYDPYVNDLIGLIKTYGYWSPEVKSYNNNIPPELDVGTVHTLARGKMRTY
jgi:hypothetical protein